MNYEETCVVYLNKFWINTQTLKCNSYVDDSLTITGGQWAQGWCCTGGGTQPRIFKENQWTFRSSLRKSSTSSDFKFNICEDFFFCFSMCFFLRSLVEVFIKSCRFQRSARGVGNKMVSLNFLENTMKTICVFISSPGYLRKMFVVNGFEHHGCGSQIAGASLDFSPFWKSNQREEKVNMHWTGWTCPHKIHQICIKMEQKGCIPPWNRSFISWSSLAWTWTSSPTGVNK